MDKELIMQISKTKIILAGRILSVLISIPFILSASMKLMGNPKVAEGKVHFGISDSRLHPLLPICK
jgi:hypothetical protein